MLKSVILCQVLYKLLDWTTVEFTKKLHPTLDTTSFYYTINYFIDTFWIFGILKMNTEPKMEWNYWTIVSLWLLLTGRFCHSSEVVPHNCCFKYCTPVSSNIERFFKEAVPQFSVVIDFYVAVECKMLYRSLKICKGLGIHLFVKVAWPGDSEMTFAVFNYCIAIFYFSTS